MATAARTRRIALLGAAVAIPALLAVGYLRLLQPAHAREMRAACRGLLPSPSQTLGELPRAGLEFTAQDEAGKPVKLSDYRGRVVVLNFWASWCKTCEAERESLEAMQRRFGDDVVVLKLASDSVWAKVRERIPASSPMTVLVDPPAEEGETGPIARQYGVQKVPESFLIDREGTVRHYIVNKRDWTSGVAGTCLRSMIDEG